jgi:hypothetical protein
MVSNFAGFARNFLTQAFSFNLIPFAKGQSCRTYALRAASWELWMILRRLHPRKIIQLRKS